MRLSHLPSRLTPKTFLSDSPLPQLTGLLFGAAPTTARAKDRSLMAGIGVKAIRACCPCFASLHFTSGNDRNPNGPRPLEGSAARSCAR